MVRINLVAISIYLYLSIFLFGPNFAAFKVILNLLHQIS